MNDSLAYRATRLHKDRDECFQGKEYLLADAGYSIASTVIPRYKGNDITAQEHRFNGLHGSARVKIEYAFGWLKLKWQSLKNLPAKIDKKRHIDRASSWTMACLILHNFCLYIRMVEKPMILRKTRIKELFTHHHGTRRMSHWWRSTTGTKNDERGRGKARRRKLKKRVLKNYKNVGRYRR